MSSFMASIGGPRPLALVASVCAAVFGSFCLSGACPGQEAGESPPKVKTLVIEPDSARSKEDKKERAASENKYQGLLEALQRQKEGLERKNKQFALQHAQAEQEYARAQAELETRQQQQPPMDTQRAMIEQQLHELEASRAQLAQQMAQLAAQQHQQQQQLAPLPENASTKVYSLRYSRAPETARILSEVLGGKPVRMAVDERTNSIIIVADKGTSDMVEALVGNLDELSGGEKREAPGETLQLRIVWLLDGLDGEGKAPSQNLISPEVVDALHDLGLDDPQVVCQQVTTLTLSDEGRRGKFHFAVPVLIASQPWQFEGQGQIQSMADERFNLEFDLRFQQRNAVNVGRGGGGFSGGRSAQEGLLGGSIYTPLGNYTVMGTTTFVATTPKAAEGTDQQQHLSAFVVYLDRAREFPAVAAEENVKK